MNRYARICGLKFQTCHMSKVLLASRIDALLDMLAGACRQENRQGLQAVAVAGEDSADDAVSEGEKRWKGHH